ncbi:DMT family transporter [Conchiformibius kuhniae]|uniref:DMT family transporter n=1 Tax=Conchiformibius kuhniae TaxID=211502 RepID=A0A8T9MXM6_9NEIS|nr:DMT family transporter [Conchiformibius kuhniae]UOP05625.1 DMT family transporter [Conchiformibius kuhniae]
MQQDKLGSGWMVVAAFFLTLMGAGVKTAGNRFGMHLYELVFWRMAAGVVILGGHALWHKRDFCTRYPKQHLWRSLAGTAALLLFFYGMLHLPLGTAVTLNYTSPFFLALLSVLLLKERPPLRVWLALSAGMAGVVVLLQPSFSAGQTWDALLCLASGAGAGYAYLKVRELSLLGEPAWRIVFYFSLTAAVVSAVAATAAGWHAPDWQSLPVLLGIGISATLGQLALTRAYHVGRKFTVSALSYLTVVLSALLGAAFFGETLGGWDVAGMILVILAGIAGSLR